LFLLPSSAAVRRRHQTDSTTVVERAADGYSIQSDDTASSIGGLGVRLASDLALPAFLSLIVSLSDTVEQSLPVRLRSVRDVHDDRHISALHEWQT